MQRINKRIPPDNLLEFQRPHFYQMNHSLPKIGLHPMGDLPSESAYNYIHLPG